MTSTVTVKYHISRLGDNMKELDLIPWFCCHAATCCLGKGSKTTAAHVGQTQAHAALIHRINQ